MSARAPYSLLFTVFAVLVGVSVCSAQESVQGEQPVADAPGKPVRAVIEMYTSQGCADCPAADALVKSYADESDVIALTFPVDYWDYLGWKDTLASPRHGERQRAYSKRFDTGPISTPEAIINGASHALGSDRDDIEQAIKATETALSSRRVEVRAWGLGPNIIIETGAAPDGEAVEATIWIAVVQKRATVKVKAGENAGKDLTYYNVVHELTPIGLWNGRPTTVRLARGSVMVPDSEDLIVMIQEADNGPIIGVAKLAH